MVKVMSGSRYSDFLAVSKVVVLERSLEYILACLGTGRCNTVLLILRYNCLYGLYIAAVLAGQRCRSRSAVISPGELGLIAVSGCRNRNCLAVRYRRKSRTVAVLQRCGSSNGTAAILGAGCRLVICGEYSINRLLILTLGAGDVAVAVLLSSAHWISPL